MGLQGLDASRVTDMVNCAKATATASGTEDEDKERLCDTAKRDV